MHVEPSELSNRERYHLMTASYLPRPIAWVSTLSLEGDVNLAPFSFSACVTTSPPILMVSVGRRRGQRKDTANNLLRSEEAVVHIPTRDIAEQMVKTSAELAPEEDEFDYAQLEKIEARFVEPPIVAGAKIAFECRLYGHQEVGDGPVDMFLLEVLQIHIDDAVLTDGRPDPRKLAALGRLGGALYCDTQDAFELERP